MLHPLNGSHDCPAKPVPCVSGDNFVPVMVRDRLWSVTLVMSQFHLRQEVRKEDKEKRITVEF